MENIRGSYKISPGSFGEHRSTESHGAPQPVNTASSFLRIASFSITTLNAILLLLGSNLPWWTWDFTGLSGLSQPAEMSNAHGFGYLSLSYFWECLAQGNGLLPASCEVTNNAELASSTSAFVKAQQSVLGGVIKTGAVRAFLVIAIMAVVAALFTSMAPLGWGEYMPVAAGAASAGSGAAAGGSDGAASSPLTAAGPGPGNIATLKAAVLSHAVAAFALLISLSAYQASAAGVDQWRFVSTFYDGLTQAQIVGSPDSVFSLGSGRSMAVAALVFELGLAGGLGYLAYIYRRQGFAPPQVSLWSRVLPSSVAHKLGAV